MPDFFSTTLSLITILKYVFYVVIFFSDLALVYSIYNQNFILKL